MVDWEDIRHFLAVAQSGTLSGAARNLKVDHATVSRRLAALEAALDVRLVDRLPRSCRLTTIGRQVFELAVHRGWSPWHRPLGKGRSRPACRPAHAQRATRSSRASSRRAIGALP